MIDHYQPGSRKSNLNQVLIIIILILLAFIASNFQLLGFSSNIVTHDNAIENSHVSFLNKTIDAMVTQDEFERRFSVFDEKIDAMVTKDEIERRFQVFDEKINTLANELNSLSIQVKELVEPKKMKETTAKAMSGVKDEQQDEKGKLTFTKPHGDRRAPLSEQKLFSFIHISKTGGASFIAMLKKYLNKSNLYPLATAGKEYGVYTQHKRLVNNTFGQEADYHAVSLRSPRAHLYSQFTECKYDSWGKYVTKGTHFPKTGINATNDEVDFNSWLGHFVESDGTFHEPDYNCYHPANFQARFMGTDLSEMGDSNDIYHHVNSITDKAHKFEPNVALAIDNTKNHDFVAITDFFHESTCLLFYRLEFADGTESAKNIEDFISDKCHCEGRRLNDVEVHITHHEGGHRSSMLDLPTSILDKIDALTKIDVILYKNALEQFLREIIWLESDEALGRTVLCEDKLEKSTEELLYIGMNVAEVYNELKTE